MYFVTVEIYLCDRCGIETALFKIMLCLTVVCIITAMAVFSFVYLI